MRDILKLTRRHLLTAAALAAPFLPRPLASAQDLPTQPVRVIVPYPPAGGADTVSRILFDKLGEMWGQQFVIDNRGGAGGTIGAAAAAKADPDGYTMLYDATAYLGEPVPLSEAALRLRQGFPGGVPRLAGAEYPGGQQRVPAKTVADVIALAKATPGGLDFASSGNGTVQHLALEMFRHMTGTKINHIPYRGGGPALNDLIGGQVKFFFSNGSASIGHIQGGAVKAIAHTGKGRLGTLPDLPAVAETLPGFEAYEWNGVFVPTGTPAAIVHKLNAGLNAVLRQPDVIARLKQLNVDFRDNTPDEFRAFVAAEMDKWEPRGEGSEYQARMSAPHTIAFMVWRSRSRRSCSASGSP